MKHVQFLLLILGLVTLISSQVLRAGSFAQVVSAAGNPSQTTSISEFGRLRESKYAENSRLVPKTAGPSGTFVDYKNFVGTEFFDSDTLAAVGEVTLSIKCPSVH